MENKRTGDGILTWDTASCSFVVSCFIPLI